MELRVPEPLVPRYQPRPRYPLRFLAAAACVGVAGWAPQPDRFDGHPLAPVASLSQPQAALDRPMPAPAVQPARVASADMGFVAESPVAAAAPVLLPQPRPASAPARKRAEASPQASAHASLLAEIAHFKTVLKLTPSQEQYWPPVDAVLREMARQQAATLVAVNEGRGAGKPPRLVIGEEDMSRLTSAAFPLLMTLNEDQKRDAMQFARAMGLERVASAL